MARRPTPTTANRLTQTVTQGSTTTYGYDGWGQLVREEAQGVTTTLVLDERGPLARVVGEARSDGTTRRYAYGPGGLAAQQTVTGAGSTVAYALVDGQGSLRALTDPSGQVVLTRHYDAFGQLRQASGSVASRLGYTGELMGAVDGAVYLRARHYQPAQGRFLQRDSFAGLPGAPQSLHRYTYAHSNPVTLTDPTGHCPICIAAAVGGVIGAGLSYGGQVYANMEAGRPNPWTDVAWDDMGMGTVEGAIGGALESATGGLLAWAGGGLLRSALLGMAEGATVNGLTQLISDRLCAAHS